MNPLLDLQSKYPHGLQLRGDVLVCENSETFDFIFKKKISIKSISENERTFLRGLRAGFDQVAVTEHLRSPRRQQILQLLESQGCLRSWVTAPVLSTPQGRQVDWLAHVHSDPQNLHRQLTQKRVLILGCGGTGCVIAEHLVRAGVRNLVLVDGGIVDLPDMNRQLAYFPSDCGRSKVAALAERLDGLASDLTIVPQRLQISSQSEIEEIIRQNRPDLVINCADTPVGLIHSWVAKACDTTQVPALFGGVALERGTLGPLLVSAPAKQKYAAEMAAAYEMLKNNSNILKASLGFTNSMMAVMIAFEAFKYLSGCLPSRIIDRSVDVDLFKLESA